MTYYRPTGFWEGIWAVIQLYAMVFGTVWAVGALIGAWGPFAK